MTITTVTVIPFQNPKKNGARAFAQITLNGCLQLKGLQVKLGSFGHFLSFPKTNPQKPYKAFEPLNHRVRESMEEKVLDEYERILVDFMISPF